MRMQTNKISSNIINLEPHVNQGNNVDIHATTATHTLTLRITSLKGRAVFLYMITAFYAISET